MCLCHKAADNPCETRESLYCLTCTDVHNAYECIGLGKMVRCDAEDVSSSLTFQAGMPSPGLYLVHVMLSSCYYVMHVICVWLLY